VTTTVALNANAVLAIAAREFVRFIRSPATLFISLFMPVIFIGLLGGSLSQNLGSGLGFNFLQFVLLGMVTVNLYQFSMGGVVSLIEDRDRDFTQEIFVAPISRYAIILGKVIGASVTSLLMIIGTFAVAVVMRIPLSWTDVGHILLIAPLLALSGAALGVFFISLVNDPQMADRGSFLLVFPQMFLTGAIIPVTHSSGVLKLLADVLPMTYLVDLVRGLFYSGKPAYHRIVLHPPALDFLVTVVFFIVFTVVGTLLFARSERNR
jgi:ABC-2 type transport system permease protein